MHGLNLWKIKKVKTVLNVLIEIVKKINLNSNKLWVDQGGEFCNKIMQEWLGNNDTLMYPTHNCLKI